MNRGRISKGYDVFRQLRLFRIISLSVILAFAILVRFPPSLHSVSFVLLSVLILIQLLLIILYTPELMKWRRLRARRFFIPVTLLIVFAAMSIFRAPYLLNAIESFNLYLFAYLFYLIAPVVFGEKRWTVAAGILMLLLISLGVTGYIEWRQGPQHLLEIYSGNSSNFPPRLYQDILHSVSQGRALSVYGNPNHLAGVLVVLLPLIWVLFTGAKGAFVKAATLALALAPLVVIYATYSRAGYILTALAVVGTVWVLFRAGQNQRGSPVVEKGSENKSKKHKLWMILISISVVIILLTAIAVKLGNSGLFGGRLLTFSTLRARGEFYLAAWKMIRSSPLLGNGLGSYEILYPQHRLLGGVEAKYPHNLFLQAWVEGGIPLLLSWLLLIISFVVCLVRRLLRPVRGLFDMWRTALAFGGFLFILHCQIDFVNMLVFLLFYFFLALAELEGGGNLTEVYQKSSRTKVKFLAIPLLMFFVPYWYFFIHLTSLAENEFRTGLALVRDNKVVEALPFYQRAVSNSPMNSTYNSHLALNYLQVGFTGRALQYGRKAVQLDPLTAHLHQSLGIIHEQRGDYQSAEKQYREATRLHPNKPDYHWKLSGIYEKTGQEERSKEEARIAREVDKGYSGSWKLKKQ